MSFRYASEIALLRSLVSNFPRWLDYFVQHGPFTKSAVESRGGA